MTEFTTLPDGREKWTWTFGSGRRLALIADEDKTTATVSYTGAPGQSARVPIDPEVWAAAKHCAGLARHDGGQGER